MYKLKPVPKGALRFRIRIKKDVRVYEWLRLGDGNPVESKLEAEEVYRVYAMSAVDQQGGQYLRMPWGTDIYIMACDFEELR